MMLQENHDGFLLWAQALSVLITKNKGKSLDEPHTNAEFGEFIPIARNQQEAIWINTLTSKL